MLELLIAHFKRFQMALNKPARIATQFPLQRKDASWGYKWVCHYCPLPSVLCPFVGSQPWPGNGKWLACRWSSTCSWSEALKTFTQQHGHSTQGPSMTGSSEANWVGSPVETWQQESEHLLKCRKEHSVWISVMLGSQPPWHKFKHLWNGYKAN